MISLRDSKLYLALKKLKNFLLRPLNPLFKASLSTFNSYSEEIHISSRKLFWNYIYCCYKYGIRPHQYCLFDFYRLNKKSKEQFACDVNTNKICAKADIFHTEGENCFNNKALFNVIFKEIIGRNYVSTQSGYTKVLEFLKAHKYVFVKPLNKKGGLGIKIINTLEYPLEDLALRLCNDELLIEEVVSQCDKMASLNKSSINTIRLVVIRDQQNEVRIVGCSLRTGRAGMIVDNAGSGGIIWPVDKNKGFVCRKGIDQEGKLYASHPDSGKLIIGFQVPRYDELVQFVKQAMDIVPQQRLVGWDVCIAPDKFIMIEGNLHPGSITFEGDGIGKKDLLKLAIT